MSQRIAIRQWRAWLLQEKAIQSHCGWCKVNILADKSMNDLLEKKQSTVVWSANCQWNCQDNKIKG